MLVKNFIKRLSVDIETMGLFTRSKPGYIEQCTNFICSISDKDLHHLSEAQTKWLMSIAADFTNDNEEL